MLIYRKRLLGFYTYIRGIVLILNRLHFQRSNTSMQQDFFYGNALKSKFITENVNINENLDIKIELVYIGEVHLFFFPLCIIWIEIARCICGVCSLNRATFKCNLIRIDRQNSNLKLN